MAWTDGSLAGAGTVASQLNHYSYFNDVADDGSVSLPVSTSGGFGFAQAGDGEEYMYFSFTSAGVVTRVSYSTNAVATNTDDKFCVYDGGSVVTVKNRLGATKKVMILVWYA